MTLATLSITLYKPDDILALLGYEPDMIRVGHGESQLRRESCGITAKDGTKSTVMDIEDNIREMQNGSSVRLNRLADNGNIWTQDVIEMNI